MRTPVLVIAFSALLFGCETKTETGALVGVGLGAGIGGAAGGWQGALIGGAAGAVTGAIVGHALDESDRQALEAQNPRTLRKIDHEEDLEVQDIKDMSKAGIKDDVIISQIRATQSQFYLTTADIIDLKNSGVSQRVIDAMIRSGA
jgi:outer membrane lipoprotein SlyB